MFKTQIERGQNMKIGNLQISGIACLAPMASVGDRAFRELCSSFGCAYTVSEMISAKGLIYNNKNTFELMENSKNDTPFSIQLFGNEPKIMAEAAVKASLHGANMIDINMGCPVPKVVSNGCGSALMRDPELCGKIVRAIKDSISLPVTVKIRKGWDKNCVNAVEVAKICELNGADAIAIHARTREEMYTPGIDLNIIKAVKQAVNIPVIGNGDIKDEQSAALMLEYSGCDMIMIGRQALGNPFIFSRVNSYINYLRIIPEPSISRKIEIMLKHIRLICKYKGELHGMKEARKHVSYYLKGLNNAAQFRKEAGQLETYDQLIELSKKVYDSNI